MNSAYHQDTCDNLAPPEQLPLISVVVFAFIVAASSVAAMPYWNWLVRALGVMLGITFLVRSLSSTVRISKELLLYVAWMTWATFGLIKAVSPPLFWEQYGTVAQIAVMIFIISGYVSSRKTLSVVLISLLVGGSIVGGYSVLTGEYARADDSSRVAGIARNSNSFGFVMLAITIVLAYLWMLPSRRKGIKYPLLVLGFGMAAVAIILSASRTALLGLMLFYLSWMWFCYRVTIFRKPKVLIGVLVLMGVGAFLFYTVFSGSVAADRLDSAAAILSDEASNEGSLYARMYFFRLGLELLLTNPVLGVGLNNFIFHSATVQMSHSEYIEVFTSTGLLGGLLYFSLFVVLWRRCGKIIHYSSQASETQIAGLIRAVLVVVLVTNLGRWYFNDKLSWIMFAGFIGYSNSIWQLIQHKWAVAQWETINGQLHADVGDPLLQSPATSPSDAPATADVQRSRTSDYTPSPTPQSAWSSDGSA